MKKYTRVCPTCNELINYKSRGGYNLGKKNNTSCKSCGTKLQYKNNPEKNKGINNGRTGTSCYDIWLKKYGIDIANEKVKELKKKQSQNSAGINNPMYGVSPSKNTGYGWAGHFDSMFFRSLSELYFLVTFKINNPNKNIKNAEEKQYSVKYIFDGTERTYKPDFICDNIVYEIKSSRFNDEIITQIKKDAAIKHFSKYNLSYEIHKPIFSYYKFIRYDLINLIKKQRVILSDASIIKLNRYAKISHFNLD